MEDHIDTAAPAARTKRRYTLIEDRKVERWYERFHVPWMLRNHAWHSRTAIVAGRVVRRLHPSRGLDAMASSELEQLLNTVGEQRAATAAELPARRTLPDWLSDLERLAALSGETGGATLETIGRLKGWRPDQMDASAGARSLLQHQLYRELEPLLRQAMRDERAERAARPVRRRRTRAEMEREAGAGNTSDGGDGGDVGTDG